MKNFFYHFHFFLSRLAEFFSSVKHLHTARYAFLHELVKFLIPIAHITKKLPAIYLAVGKFDRLLAAKPRKTQKQIGHILLIAKTQRGKTLNAETNALAWQFPFITLDIKKTFYPLTAGYRETLGKVFVVDPQGNGASYNPLEGKNTEFELHSAASILLYRANEGENQIFTDSAITMLTQIFIAARLEEEDAKKKGRAFDRPLPFAYKMMNKGFYGAATILQIISLKHNYYPNLATTFLDIDYDKADFDSRFLRDCWGTLTRRMRRILTKESVRCFNGSDFTPKDIITSGAHPISVYLNFPEQHLLSLAPLIELVLDSLLNGMTAYYDKVLGKGCFRVLVILDEIFRIGFPNLKHYTTTALGRDVTLFVTAQSDSQVYAAFGQYNAEVIKEQFDYIVNYRPAPAGNRTAHHIEESLGYTSGFAHSKTDHEHGSSQGESEQRVALMPYHETKYIDDLEVVVEMDGVRPTIAQRLDWRDFPELVRRANMKPPAVEVLPPLDERFTPTAEPRPASQSAWRHDPALLRWGRPLLAASDESLS